VKIVKKKNPAASVEQPQELPVRNASESAGHRSFVIYGRSGTGKTTLGASFPKPALLLDVNDRGTDSVSDVEGLKIMDIHNWEDLELAYWWLYKNPDAYKTVIIDTVSQLQQLAVMKILTDRNKGEEKKVKGRTHVSPTDFGVMTRQGWGDVASLMKTWITNYRDLPVEMVFIAQDRVFNSGEENDDTEAMLAPEVGPQLSPSIVKHLNAAVHLIGNTFIRQRTVEVKVRDKAGKLTKKEVEKTEFCLRIGPNPIYVTKIRKPKSVVPPSILVDPSYSNLIGLIKGK
jgi:hypothetical protein